MTEPNIFEKINQNDLEGLKNILLSNEINVNIYDGNGMTPLQHAAYKGNAEIVQILLDQGADVNACQHENKYAALHFAALSGNINVCEKLLIAGAKTHVTNSVGRTPSQMAAFVGNHSCVVVINNFVPKADVDYYTIPQGLETEPKLPPILANPLHKFISQVNVHPVRIILNLQRSKLLLDNTEILQKILSLMCEREMKRHECNEVMSFKFHYLAFFMAEITKYKKRMALSKADKEEKEEKKESTAEDTEEKRSSDPLEQLAKKMLKTGRSGNPDFQESFLRECVREFPFRECTTFHQMVQALTSKDPPSALIIITSAINGQRVFSSEVPYCTTCGEEKASKKCSKCKTVVYCDRECQRLHWFLHKKACARLAQQEPIKTKSPSLSIKNTAPVNSPKSE